jgi:hypothetical protein
MAFELRPVELVGPGGGVLLLRAKRTKGYQALLAGERSTNWEK